MLKRILFIGILLSFFIANSQHTISGKINPPKNYSWLILYQLNGVNQKYIANTTVKDGAFSMEIPKDAEAGIYRLLYDNTRNVYVDFIYNKEDIQVEFHPDYPTKTATYFVSEENKIFQNYFTNITTLQNKLDSLQVAYFKESKKSNLRKLDKLYKKSITNLRTAQNRHEKNATGKIAKEYIIANTNYYADKLIKKPVVYLDSLKKHYFDFIDFESAALQRSSLFVDRINNYIFYLNTSDDPKTLANIYKTNMVFVLSKINKAPLKKEIIESLLYTFAQQENLEMVTYLFENHFEKLPVAMQDYEFKGMINDMLKTTIGFKAPNLVWEEKGKEKSLHTLKGYKHYVIVFWSTTCPHCLEEMPRLQKYLEANKSVQVIAIGLETNESKIAWIDEKFYYEDFIHLLGKDKYNNKYVRDYGVNSTPSFFLLDSTKTIIAKPYDVKEFKEVYTKIEKSKKK